MGAGGQPRTRVDGVSWLELDTTASRTVFMEINHDRAAVTRTRKLIQKDIEGYAAGNTPNPFNPCVPFFIGFYTSAYPSFTSPSQLYDLVNDVQEQDNVFGNSANDAEFNALQDALNCHIGRSAIGVDLFVACQDKPSMSIH